ncbi:MAG TPA: HD domain-containing protein [Bordetella sp.]|nr:HD domain-containing protein [Bordetella sp.]
MTLPILHTLETLYRDKATHRYGLADVSQLQHALQSAALAERNGEPANVIAAALLHDVGHMIHGLGENPAAQRVDDTHEERAAAWLDPHFGADVVEPIRLHVAAKRYLCAMDHTYFGKLASDSVRSLALQGGPMSAEEVAQFERLPYFSEAVRLRRYDDQAKDPAMRTPPFAYFLACVEGALSRA